MKTMRIAFVLACLLSVSRVASAVPFTLNAGNPTQTVVGTSGSLSASAMFTLAGGILTVVLTNTSAADVLVPSEVLTALFFNVLGNPILTPVSALLSGGSTVFFGPNGGGNVGGEFAYANSLAGAPGGANEGISSAGFGLFGNANFGGANLEGPVAVDGLNYGITSAGDNLGTGNAEVTGNIPLIKNQVTFVLSGAGSSLTIGPVAFQYGTSLTDISICPDCGQNIPEPASLALLGSGLVLGAMRLRRRKS